MRAYILAFSMLILASLSGAHAVSEDGGRYTMTPTEGGVVRLDTQTGAMSLCTRKASDEWSCTDMNDSQRTLTSEVDRLQKENKELKEQVDNLEKTLGIADGQSDATKPPVKLTLPSEADVDKAFDYFERMINKLHERIETFEQKHARGDGTAL
jgi:septal ring factor EnvC (AmiA/AmiB activator)